MKIIKKGLSSLIFATTLTLLAGVQSLYAEDYGIKAFYGDKALDRVVIVDVDNMTSLGSVDTEGIDPYPVDQAGELDKVYAITRGSNSIDVINTKTFEHMGLIELPHHPRSSEACNETLRLQLVTGADKPMASLIDVVTDTVVASVGINESFPVSDYGGSNATGHPFWFNDSMFALIDRPNRTIHLYEVTKKGKHGKKFTVRLLDSVTTPTAVHHFVARTLFTNGKDIRTFYALAEGAADRDIAPSILKFRLTATNKLKFINQTPLSNENIDIMGSHHANMHPDGIHMYIGSTEGNLYVLNTSIMKIVKKIPAGLGAGHTTFAAKRNLAIVTNHKDRFVTIIDTNTHTAIKNVTVSGIQQNEGVILQSHSSFVHPNGEFFYAFASDNGIFYELDLTTLEVSRTVDTGGTPLQGVFICQSAACENLM